MYHADHAIHIGHDHVRAGILCEDYAWSEVTEKYALAIISDGCSSGAATDIGARLTTLAYRNVLRTVAATRSQLGSPAVQEEIDAKAMKLVWASAAMLSLERNDLLATVGFVIATPTSVLIRLIGDGVVALMGADGHTLMHRFEWDNSTPFYPVYHTGTDVAEFVRAHGADEHTPRFHEEQYLKRSTGELELIGRQSYSVANGIHGFTLQLEGDARERLSGVALFSDGITQVQETPWYIAASDALAYKSIAGVFVRRRLLRLTKTWNTDGHEHHDDLSCATVLLNTGKEDGHEQST